MKFLQTNIGAKMDSYEKQYESLKSLAKVGDIINFLGTEMTIVEINCGYDLPGIGITRPSEIVACYFNNDKDLKKISFRESDLPLIKIVNK